MVLAKLNIEVLGCSGIQRMKLRIRTLRRQVQTAKSWHERMPDSWNLRRWGKAALLRHSAEVEEIVDEDFLRWQR